ncbi:SCO6745 family protein, partial [Saccharopolyspora kobensis]
MTGEIAVARRMWWLLEPIHAVLYYAPAAFEHAGGLGYAVRERWPSYFAWRAAPLGAVDAETVAEAFYSFSPRMVAEHVPAAWQIAAPQQVLSARLAAIEDFYRSMPGVAALAEAAGLARRAAESARTRGRALAA